MDVYVSRIVLLVRDHEKAKKFYRDILDLEPDEEVEGFRGTPGAFRSANYRIGNCKLELITPPGSDAILLNRSLEKRGEGIHHFGLNVSDSDMDTVIKRCQAAGIRLVDEAGDIVKPGARSGFTDPQVTHKTLINFIGE